MRRLLEQTPQEFADRLRKAGRPRAYVVRDETGGYRPSHPSLDELADYLANGCTDCADHEGFFFEVGRETGTLHGVCLHKTVRGQAQGGLRYWPYACMDDFLRDGLRLSRGMTRKSALAGLHWGGGLYVNYALLAGWALDCLWWWRGLEAYRRRPRRIVLCWNGFLIFIVFNATVVFETGLARWFGLCLCLGICSCWCYNAKRLSGQGGALTSVPSAHDPSEGHRSKPL